MIHTTFEEMKRYESMNPFFAGAFKAIAAMKEEAFVKGRHEVDGDNVYVNAIEYDTKPEKDCIFEAHRKYIDVMYLYEGEEFIGYTPLKNLKNITMPYNEKDECCLAALEPETMKIHMLPGDVCILFPEDAHAPSMQAAESVHVKKLIAKVLL